MKALLALLLCSAVLGLATPAVAAVVPQDEKVPPIQEEGDFYILNFSEDPEQALTLEDFVQLCQEATSLNFTYTEETADLLRKAKVVMLGAKRIAKRDFYAFFQIQMFINEFVCMEVGPERMLLIMIQSLSTGPGRQGAGNRMNQKPVFVQPDEVEDYEDFPATLITTTLFLPNTEVRQLSTSMRTMLPDQQTQQMIPVGDHAVILTGFGTQVAALVKLLTLVDNLSAEEDPPAAVFDVRPMEYAAAEDVADLIDQLIEAGRTRAASAPRGRNPDGQPAVPQGIGTGDLEPQVLVDTRTNSLLIMALPDEMPRIKELVARLDVDVLEPERNFHIYDLQHMNAEDLADTLDEFLSGAESLDAAQGGTGGRAGQPTGGRGGSRTTNEVVVVADAPANALLIAANKTRYEEVLDLVRQLDRRQDQVLIETALIELTGTDFRDIGVELAFADSEGDGGFFFSGFGLSTLEDLNGDDGIPDTRVPGVPSDGMVGGILRGDNVNLPFLIAAAQRTDGANVLNVPSVLVNNNGSAKVTTLNELPTTTITQTGTTGGTQENFRDWESAGITLEISPSISASNYLRLDVSLVVQTFVGSSQSGNSAVPAPRVTREIHTNVNVPDGDTMVIGGIITDNLTETTRGIPFLMDLPIIRHFFSRKSTTNSRTTLYFFVTPHILRDRDFADLAEISYRHKQDAAREIGQDRVRVIDPDFDVDSRRLDETFQIPSYRGPERGEVSDPEDIGLDAQRRARLLREHRAKAGAGSAAGGPSNGVESGGQTSEEGS